jgi:hypothetical protein
VAPPLACYSTKFRSTLYKKSLGRIFGAATPLGALVTETPGWLLILFFSE